MSETTQSDAHLRLPGEGHVVSFRLLIAVGMILLLLTLLTVLAIRVDLGAANIFIALGIAVVKAGFVALYFMHLRWDRPFNGVVFIGSLFFVALFIGLALIDTSEYQPDVLPGDAPGVQQKLQELEP